MTRNIRIQEEAARWLMQLDRADDSHPIRQQFELWLAADSSHRQAYLELEEVWRSSDGLKTWRPRDGSIDARILKSPREKRASFALRWGWAVAASLVLIVGASIAWFVDNPMGTAAYRTDVGAYQRVPLRDGSLVQLNTDTLMKVRFEDARREVRLLKGEAHFQVAPNKQRPFEVIAGETIVRAVGTAFTVRVRDGDDVQVVVTEGSVLVRPLDAGVAEKLDASGSAPRTVSAGEMADAKLDRLEVRPVSPPEVSRRLAWQRGELVFEGMSLTEAVAEFNRYNERRLEISDAALTDVRIGGNFRATDVDGFVRALQASFDIRARETDGVIHLDRSR